LVAATHVGAGCRYQRCVPTFPENINSKLQAYRQINPAVQDLTAQETPGQRYRGYVGEIIRSQMMIGVAGERGRRIEESMAEWAAGRVAEGRNGRHANHAQAAAAGWGAGAVVGGVHSDSVRNDFGPHGDARSVRLGGNPRGFEPPIELECQD
jgi:hypothetical protein